MRKARKLLRLARKPRYRRALRYGVAAAVEHDNLPYPRDVRTVVDVGAHKGQFALFALERFPAAAIICIEPLDEPRRMLGLAVSQPDRVQVLKVAASNRNRDRVQMHVSRLDDSSSLQLIGPQQVAAFPGTEEASRTWVPTARLDSLIAVEELRGPALLKIDVQGHEYEVLEGGDSLLRSFRQIVVEVSFAELYKGQKLAGDVTSLLQRAGLSLAGVFNVKVDRSGRCLQADFLFEQRDDPENDDHFGR